jgi:hypothetical protein
VKTTFITGFHLSTAAQSTAGTSPSAQPANAANMGKRSSLLSEVTIDMVGNNRKNGGGGGGNKGFSRIARLVGSGSGTYPSASSEDRTQDSKDE